MYLQYIHLVNTSIYPPGRPKSWKHSWGRRHRCTRLRLRCFQNHRKPKGCVGNDKNGPGSYDSNAMEKVQHAQEWLGLFSTWQFPWTSPIPLLLAPENTMSFILGTLGLQLWSLEVLMRVLGRPGHMLRPAENFIREMKELSNRAGLHWDNNNNDNRPTLRW